MKLFTAVWLVLRGTLHVFGGYFTIRFRFSRLSRIEREACVVDWARGLLRIWRIDLEVRGAPPSHGPVLLVSNHISWLDIVVIHAARYCRFVSKADIKAWPLIGALATGAGTLYITRESRRDALRTVHRMADALKAGEVLAVFPEGTTSNGLALLPFHANLLQAAISSGAPVQPMALQFVDKVTGEISLAPCYVGDETLVGSIWRTLTTPGIRAVVSFGEPQLPELRERREWAGELRQAVDALRTY
ncbi:lysophospholipid acyltransferase family protein [Ottowia thiooxydans]|uniref:lysophospholipid acyltransferase family protein n=1 Tax=Ottowia thiooxydans TaxID=219182 RepID=UPI0003F6CB77|nr:lysophospholipid acyltransferase family protein [Ottowia thiooxydans]